MEEPEKQDENETFDFYSELGNMEDIDLVSFAYQITSGMVNKIIFSSFSILLYQWT